MTLQQTMIATAKHEGPSGAVPESIPSSVLFVASVGHSELPPVAAGDNVNVSMNHFPGLLSSTVQRMEASPEAGDVQIPVADVFSSPLVCVRPSSSEGAQAANAFEFVPGANDPVSAVRGDMANPTKLPPPSVTTYSVHGVYVEALGKAGENVKEKPPLPEPRVPCELAGDPSPQTPEPAPLANASAP